MEQPARPVSAGEPHGLRHPFGIVGVAVLEVGGHREVGRRHDRGGVVEGLGPGHVAVEAAQRGGEPAAGGGQGGEADGGEDAGGAGVPGVGHHEDAGPLVERAEGGDAGGGVGHESTICPVVPRRDEAPAEGTDEGPPPPGPSLEVLTSMGRRGRSRVPRSQPSMRAGCSGRARQVRRHRRGRLIDRAVNAPSMRIQRASADPRSVGLGAPLERRAAAPVGQWPMSRVFPMARVPDVRKGTVGVSRSTHTGTLRGRIVAGWPGPETPSRDADWSSWRLRSS